MTLQSMTGFARASGAFENFTWLWEMKSVNGRGLEIRCRMPSGYDALEDKIRKHLKKMFRRGSLNIHLHIKMGEGKSDYKINEALLNDLIARSKSLSAAHGLPEPNVDVLMAVRGVVEHAEQPELDEDAHAQLEAALLSDFEKVCLALRTVRGEEGEQLKPVLTNQVDEIEQLIKKATECAALRPENQRLRLEKQMASLLENSSELEEGRLEQELAILATKADISEELDRLVGHVEAVRVVLDKGLADGVGRRLDFICQEFNREANTLCSKSNDKELTQVGLDLKVIIDRFREQVQNIE